MLKNYYTKKSLFNAQAPSWNFTLGEDELLARALELKFVVKVGEDKYEENPNYQGMSPAQRRKYER